MTTNWSNSGSIVSGSDVSGAVGGERAQIHVENKANAAAIQQESEALHQALARIAQNEAQQSLLVAQVDALRAAAEKRDEPGFKASVGTLDTLLRVTGTSLKSVAEAFGAIKTIAGLAGFAPPLLG